MPNCHKAEPATTGKTLGILGGGQLGRMLILAGHPLGYRFKVFTPKASDCASLVADETVIAEYSDEVALRNFAKNVDLITFEFENIPVAVFDQLATLKPLLPDRNVLHICQNRQHEKDFLKQAQFPCAPFEYADSIENLRAAVTKIGHPCVIKTATSGYDGRGQVKINGTNQEPDFYKFQKTFEASSCVVVEKWIPHRGEFSVICARKADGSKATFPMAENVHRNHILHASIVPARIPSDIQAKGEACARHIADHLDLVGLIAVEFFLDATGQLIVNEMAPRPHNSGHYTMDACLTSQFEQHLRAITDLPFGPTKLQHPAVMINLLGDLWKHGEPDWSSLLKDPDIQLHLYDKGVPKPGRKMGHFTVLGNDLEATLAKAEAHFAKLARNEV